MDGVRLGARFSLTTNRLRYCGPADAAPVLYRAITDGTGLSEAADALSRFEALYPYLEAIARRSGLRPFDEAVVEAYWLGNQLLDGFGADEFRGILAALSARGLPSFVERELAAALPPHPVPHHAFHVAFVGVGAVTGHVETTLPNMESCRPSWGLVTEVGPGRLEVDRPKLTAAGGELGLGAVERVSVSYDPRFFPGLSVGDAVAIHWGWAAVRLEPEQLSNLVRYTTLALEQANAGRRAARDRNGS